MRHSQRIYFFSTFSFGVRAKTDGVGDKGGARRLKVSRGFLFYHDTSSNTKQ